MSDPEIVPLPKPFEPAMGRNKSSGLKLSIVDDGHEIHCDVSVLRIQPGDILVLKVDGHITQEMAERIKRTIDEGFGLKAMVLDRSTTIVGVLRPGI